ncbi:CCDC90 family protein [Candidatus Dependentiae bacterium]|nr:CCDC90 family protein [Candidatus Dependentiae bacterium]MBU4387284.1 CCDC90 family protein [Candidatus Dependentiae bacterium]MCG2756649.1 CCDC90 family protein [Candidatus Dependentiae bacterium]
MKISLKQIFVYLLCSVSLVNAGHGGSSFGGAMAGGMMGSMLGSAMTQPREKTVVVQSRGGDISRREITKLEQNLRDEISRLEDIVRSDLNKLYDRLREAESTIRDLEAKHAKTEPVVVKPVKKHVEPVDIEPIEEMEERELE